MRIERVHGTLRLADQSGSNAVRPRWYRGEAQGTHAERRRPLGTRRANPNPAPPPYNPPLAHRKYPEQEACEIAQRQEPKGAEARAVAEYQCRPRRRAEPNRNRSQQDCDAHGVKQPERSIEQREGQRPDEPRCDKTNGPRSARFLVPVNLMPPPAPGAVEINGKVDKIRQENHALAELENTPAELVILHEIIGERRKPAHCFERRPAQGNRGAETHPARSGHVGEHRARDELGVVAEQLEPLVPTA